MSEQEKNTEQGVHKRRTRYKGKYPRKFEEKYKELQPEKYQDMIAHVIQKGNTPAGMHISIMVQEILDFLQIQPGQRGRAGRICKDKKTSGRTGIWGGYFNNPSSELLYYR